MNTYIQWSHLTDAQQKQVKSFFQEELDNEKLYEHDLNKQRFLVNITNGSVIFRKDF